MTTRSRGRLQQLALGIVLLLLLAACTSQTGPDPGHSGATPGAAAVAAHGSAPGTGGGITYQPDVVIVGGGAASIRGVSDDSLTWTIDAGAAHASDLAVGKVMLLTSDAVGRVLRLTRKGDLVDVLLGPVQLGDIVRDGHIHLDQAIDGSAAVQRSYPGVGAQVTARPTATPTIAHADWQGGPVAVELAALSTAGHTLDVGRYQVNIAMTSSRASFGVTIPDSRGLVIATTFAANYSGLHVLTDMNFVSGQVQGGSYFYLDGLRSLELELAAGSHHGLSDNVHETVSLPINESVQLPSEPVPLVFSTTMVFTLDTAFSATNSTVGTKVLVALDGRIGMRMVGSGWAPVLPTAHLGNDPVADMHNLSVGITGLVLATRVRFQVGLGMPPVRVGPYVQEVMSLALTGGSAVGAVVCRQATLDVIGSAGLNLTADLAQWTWLTKALGAFANLLPRLVKDVGTTSHPQAHLTRYAPVTPVCRI